MMLPCFGADENTNWTKMCVGVEILQTETLVTERFYTF